MKKLILAAALATAASGTIAHADDHGPYVTVEGGGVKQERADVRDSNSNFRSDRFRYGWEAGGAVGYDFGKFRLEAEGFHHESWMKSEQTATGLYTRDANTLSGNSYTTAFMGNVLFGLGHWGGVKAYAGGGVGWASIVLHENSAGSVPVNNRDNGYAWQAIAGVTVPVTHNIDLGVKYRYFRPDGTDLFRNAQQNFAQTSLRSHSVLATLTYNFGRAAAEPAPPPRPAAAASAAPSAAAPSAASAAPGSGVQQGPLHRVLRLG
jgi:opacity protein-like surface antigen